MGTPVWTRTGAPCHALLPTEDIRDGEGVSRAASREAGEPRAAQGRLSGGTGSGSAGSHRRGGEGSGWEQAAADRSVARDQDRPDSDVDLLVDLDVATRGLFPLLALRYALERLLPGERVDMVASTALRPEVLAAALADAIDRAIA